jgi:hypothetical protein
MRARHWRRFIFRFLISNSGSNTGKTDPTRSIFGPSVPREALLFLGAIAGTLFGADTQSMLEPFLYVLPAAWFFQVFIKIWGVVRYPRAHAWPFVLGLSYGQRLDICGSALNRSLREFLPFAAACVSVFFLVRSMALHRAAWGKLAECAGLFSIEAVLLFGILMLAVGWKLVLPKRKDRIRIAIFSLLLQTMHFPSTFFYKIIRNITRRFLPGTVAVLVLRQSMYLIRMDFFSLVLFPLLALALASVLLVVCKGAVAYVGEAAAVLAPFYIMIDRTPVFDESARKLASCPYYYVTVKNRFYANLCMAAVFCIPFIAVFLIARAGGSCLALPDFLFHACAFLIGIAAAAFFMARRWLRPEWDGSQAAMAATTVLCCVLGCAIPRWGMLFPLLSVAGTWWLGLSGRAHSAASSNR